MRALTKIFLIVLLAVTLTSCSKFRSYNGPQVTRILILKSARQLLLLNNDKVLKSYDIDLGFAPIGDKKIQGDGKTPEGRYYIDRLNPNSKFHLSLGISYPDTRDVAEARKLGEEPGGDIFIHGGPTLYRDRNRKDWTWGCISVSNREIETIYAMVQVRTIVDIMP